MRLPFENPANADYDFQWIPLEQLEEFLPAWEPVMPEDRFSLHEGTRLCRRPKDENAAARSREQERIVKFRDDLLDAYAAGYSGRGEPLDAGIPRPSQAPDHLRALPNGGAEIWAGREIWRVLNYRQSLANSKDQSLMSISAYVAWNDNGGMTACFVTSEEDDDFLHCVERWDAEMKRDAQ